MTYLYLVLAVLIICVILGGILSYFEGGQVDYWENQEIANVLLTYHVKGRRQTSGYSFEKDKDGKWKYIINHSSLRIMLLLFLIFVIVFLGGFIIFGGVTILDLVITFMLIAVLWFIVLIGDPIVAYFILMKYLKKSGQDTD